MRRGATKVSRLPYAGASHTKDRQESVPPTFRAIGGPFSLASIAAVTV